VLRWGPHKGVEESNYQPSDTVNKTEAGREGGKVCVCVCVY
jgi:hypothetical protein